MTKYIRVEFPEIQYFMDSPNWNDCYYGFSEETEFNDRPSCYFVPEDLYDEVMYKLQFPKKYENTNLGTIVCYETRAVVNGNEIFWYDLSNIKKGNKVLVYNKEDDNWTITQCVSAIKGFPILLEESKYLDGINCEIIGHYDPEIPS